MSKPNEYDTYIIPPNFIEGGTFFGGLLKLRNTVEALVIVLAIGIPVFSVSALTLTAKSSFCALPRCLLASSRWLASTAKASRHLSFLF